LSLVCIGLQHLVGIHTDFQKRTVPHTTRVSDVSTEMLNKDSPSL
jgi:hypothetical protein